MIIIARLITEESYKRAPAMLLPLPTLTSISGISTDLKVYALKVPQICAYFTNLYLASYVAVLNGGHLFFLVYY